jgi:hypothetical protein
MVLLFRHCVQGRSPDSVSMSTVKRAAIAVLLLGAVAILSRATTISVTNTNDSGAGSLRQALASANDGDTIDATGVSGVITLTSGELLVGKSVTINGAGANVLAVDGNATSSVFQIGSGSTAPNVAISGLTIRNGQGGFGGGVFNGGAAILTIVSSAVTGNTAGLGGGIFNTGTLNIVSSTVSGNSAKQGAGTYNNGANMTITDSTFSGNTASVDGGGSVNHFAVQIANSTFSKNSGEVAGGVLNTGTLEIGNSILNAGDSGANISNGGGTVTSLGYNLSSDNGGGFLTGPGDQINTDPRLGPLQDNGGPTFTHQLLPGSPAIDSGDPNFTPPPSFDQRGPGFDRVVNGRIDKGSFEVQTQTVAIQLQASGRKVGGINTSRLTWSGATSSNIDVYRDGNVIATVPNTGSHTDSTGTTGRATFTYKVCEAGTQTCSNDARVRFRR